jgi:hypothetical protein
VGLISSGGLLGRLVRIQDQVPSSLIAITIPYLCVKYEHQAKLCENDYFLVAISRRILFFKFNCKCENVPK